MRCGSRRGHESQPHKQAGTRDSENSASRVWTQSLGGLAPVAPSSFQPDVFLHMHLFHTTPSQAVLRSATHVTGSELHPLTVASQFSNSSSSTVQTSPSTSALFTPAACMHASDTGALRIPDTARGTIAPTRCVPNQHGEGEAHQGY